jgi:ABC-2 type transport system permease protein
MVFAAMRALIAAIFMFPIGVLILGSVPWRSQGAPEFAVILVLGALVGSAMGLTMGTLVPPNRISIAFSLVLTPLLFTGCSQYPWPTLDRLRWFQVVTAFNPLTYVSEGMRGALVPNVDHIRSWVCVVALLVSLAVFAAIGIRGFIRRAID